MPTDYNMPHFSELPTLGILGGMGPGAAVDFQQRLLNASPVTKDQDHIPTIVWNHGGIPDRQLALQNLGESPLNAMRHGLKILEKSGVSKIVIPCNTAHFWHTELQQQTEIEIISMVKMTVQKVLSNYKVGDKVGILATKGALATELYQRELNQFDIPFIIHSDQEIEHEFMPAVYSVKRNEIKKAGVIFQDLSQRLVQAGASSIILACTEIPLGLHAIHSPILNISFDTTQILADACIDWYYHRR